MMDDPRQPFADAIRGLARTAKIGDTRRPTPEELIAYFEGRLSPAEAERLQDLIALDPDSARALLDLEALARMEAPEEDASPQPHVPKWESLRAKLGEDDARPAAAAAPPALPSSPRSGLRLGLAAALPVALALVLWLLATRLQPLWSPGPTKNVLYYDLLPEDSVRERNGAGTGFTISPGGQSYVLVLNVGDHGDAHDYRIKIETTDGREVWSQDGFKPSPYGTFSLMLPPSFLSPGSYRIHLLRIDGDLQEPVAVYRFELRAG